MPDSEARDATVFEVRDALGEPGCAVCRLVARSVERLIRSIAYEQVNDIDLRARLRRARGFCNAHAYQWLERSHNVLGTALIYRDVLLATLEADLTPGAVRRPGLLGGLFTTAPERPDAQRECILCDAQADAETRYVKTLVVVVNADPTALERSDGLCRVHTLTALRTAHGAASSAIASRARAAVEALVAELDEVIRKEDYRFRHEERSEADRTAPARAIAWSIGSEGLTAP